MPTVRPPSAMSQNTSWPSAAASRASIRRSRATAGPASGARAGADQAGQARDRATHRQVAGLAQVLGHLRDPVEVTDEGHEQRREQAADGGPDQTPSGRQVVVVAQQEVGDEAEGAARQQAEE